MKRIATLLAALALACPSGARAMEVVHNDTMTLNTDGYIQWLAVGQAVPDRVRSDDRLYLFLKQARLRFNGTVGDTKFDMMWSAGGEDVATTNNALGLLDFNFDVPLAYGLTTKIGQFHVPYGRERMTDDSTMNFGDRSIQNLGFAWNRDVGAALMANPGKFAAILAVMTGGGRDVPQRYLPEKLGTPLFVARLGYNDGYDPANFHLQARAARPDSLKKAFFVNGLYIKDSPVGHSTVLNVRAIDKNLLINPNWNPYVALKPYDQAKVWQAGADAAVRGPLGSGSWSAEAEANVGNFKNNAGSLYIKGGRVQAGVARKDVELNLRYAVLWLDKRMKSPSGIPLLTDKKPLQEITPSLTYHYRPNVTVVADMPILLKMLVFQENTAGSYVASEQPDQAAVVKAGTIVGTGRAIRKTVPEARLMVQFSF